MSIREKLHSILFPTESARLEQALESEKKREEAAALVRQAAIREEEARYYTLVYALLLSQFLDKKIEAIGDTKVGVGELKDLWRNSPHLIRYPFPVTPINVMDDGVRVIAEWGPMDKSQREYLTIMIYGATGKFLHINEHKSK